MTVLHGASRQARHSTPTSILDHRPSLPPPRPTLLMDPDLISRAEATIILIKARTDALSVLESEKQRHEQEKAAIVTQLEEEKQRHSSDSTLHALEKASLLAAHTEQRQLRQAMTTRLLNLSNSPQIMVKVTPQTCTSARRLKNFTYNHDTIAYTKSRAGTLRTNIYTCDQVFHAKTPVEAKRTNELVYTEISHMVASVLTGRNLVLMGYGASGTGKSSTLLQNMNGETCLLDQTINTIYANNCTVSFACIQDYKGQASDILPTRPRTLTISTRVDREKEKYRYYMVSSSGTPHTPTHFPSKSALLTATTSVISRRKSAVTANNAHSSRSHAIYSLHVYSATKAALGILTMVDLAGKENLPATAKPSQKAESKYINDSLYGLRNLVRALALSPRHAGSPAFSTDAQAACRDCTLTQLLGMGLWAEAQGSLPCVVFIGFVREFGDGHGGGHTGRNDEQREKENESTLFYLHDLAQAARELKPLTTTSTSLAKSGTGRLTPSPSPGTGRVSHRGEYVERICRLNTQLRALLDLNGIPFDLDALDEDKDAEE